MYSAKPAYVAAGARGRVLAVPRMDRRVDQACDAVENRCILALGDALIEESLPRELINSCSVIWFNNFDVGGTAANCGTVELR